MSVLLYRYLKKKYDQRRQGVTQAENTPQLEAARLNNNSGFASQQPTENVSAGTTKAQLIRTVMLMVALTIPVFLETLDYTGTHCLYSGGYNPCLTYMFPVVATAQVQIAVRLASKIALL